MIDIRERRIPDRLVYPAIALLSVVRVLEGGAGVEYLVACAMGAAVFAFVRAGAQERLGAGDVKASAAIGLLLGFWGYVFAVLFACLIGIVWISVGSWRTGGRMRERVVAFMPFLTAGAALAWLLRGMW